VTEGVPPGRASFATTRWSIVLAAAGSDPAQVRAALSDLAAVYWYPLYADARRRGATSADAADLVQGLFAELIEKDWVAAADPERGRFRAFLLTAFRRHAGRERDRARTAKRGGGAVLRLDFTTAESRLSLEPADTRTPERAFEQRFAFALLARVLDRVRADRPGDEDLLPFVGGPGAVRAYAEIAAARGTSEGAVKVAVHRLRERWRDTLRDEVRATVAADADVDDEIRHLMDAIAAD
jgi:DNA-directed RNA polymerase specialized sigma24 family protein